MSSVGSRRIETPWGDLVDYHPMSNTKPRGQLPARTSTVCNFPFPGAMAWNTRRKACLLADGPLGIHGCCGHSQRQGSAEQGSVMSGSGVRQSLIKRIASFQLEFKPVKACPMVQRCGVLYFVCKALGQFSSLPCPQCVRSVKYTNLLTPLLRYLHIQLSSVHISTECPLSAEDVGVFCSLYPSSFNLTDLRPYRSSLCQDLFILY